MVKLRTGKAYSNLSRAYISITLIVVVDCRYYSLLEIVMLCCIKGVCTE